MNIANLIEGGGYYEIRGGILKIKKEEKKMNLFDQYEPIEKSFEIKHETTIESLLARGSDQS